MNPAIFCGLFAVVWVTASIVAYTIGVDVEAHRQAKSRQAETARLEATERLASTSELTCIR